MDFWLVGLFDDKPWLFSAIFSGLHPPIPQPYNLFYLRYGNNLNFWGDGKENDGEKMGL